MSDDLYRNSMKKIATGVIGVGYLGTFHAQKYDLIEQSNLIGVYDPDNKRADSLASSLGCRNFNNIEELLSQVDAVSIVTPTSTHFEIMKLALNCGVHVFVEKPICTSLDEADEIIYLADKKGLKLQVGHLERFNPAFMKIRPLIKDPLFIESTRIAPYSPRNIDVAVLLDLMIHDIDIILQINSSPVVSVDALGAVVFSESFDISTARLKFKNGCVADLKASRLSEKVERKLRIFQKNSCLLVDFLNQTTAIYTSENAQGSESKINKSEEKFEKSDLIKLELESFLNSIANNTEPVVSGSQAREALKVTLMAMNDITNK